AGRGTGRQRPLPHLVGLRVEPPDVSAGIVAVPHRAVGRERYTARPRPDAWQRVLPELERARVHGGDLVGAEQRDPRPVALIHHDAVGARVGRRHPRQADLAAGDGELAHHVAALRAEPDVATAVEHHCVRVADRAVGHGITRDVPVARVEPADVAHEIAGEPHHSPPVDDQVVRSGPRVEWVASELMAEGIEYRAVMPHVTDANTPAVRSYYWLARTSSIE